MPNSQLQIPIECVYMLHIYAFRLQKGSVYICSYRIHMWVMEEFGLAESWTKLLNICLEATSIMPFGSRKSGEVVFRMCNGELVSVNPKTKQVKKFVTDGCKYQFMDSFVESLVLLEQPNAISY